MRPQFFLIENVRGLRSAAISHRPITKGEMKTVVCPVCGKMTTVDVKGCGNCGAVLDQDDERVTTLAKHLAQQWESDWLRELEAVLWSGGQA
jgi:site-specific DNA-cytosine methylase